MKRWFTICLAVALCLCMALPALVEAQESVTAKYNMKIWGRVKFDIHYDTCQFVNYNDFLGAPGDSHLLGIGEQDNDSSTFNPRDTRLGFSAMHSVDQWVGKAVVEIDFYGTNAGNNLIPRMRLGYVDLSNKDMGLGIRAGQDWIPISQLNPSTIDFGILSASGNLWWRVPQVTVRQDLDVGDGMGLQLLASAMRHRRTDTASETKMPWIIGRAALSFEALDGKHMVAVGAGYQDDKDQTTKDDLDRWLVCGEAKLNLGPVLVKGELWTGQGVDGHYLRYDLDTYRNDSGRTRVWEAWGGWIDATYKIIPEWSITAGFGIDDPDDSQYNARSRNQGLSNRTFQYNYTYYGTTWYSLTEAIKVGAEFMWLEARREDPATGENYKDKGTRTTASIFYLF